MKMKMPIPTPMKMMPESNHMLTPTHAAGILGITVRQLKRLRLSGQGPPSYRVTYKTVRYYRQDVDAWLKGRKAQ